MEELDNQLAELKVLKEKRRILAECLEAIKNGEIKLMDFYSSEKLLEIIKK